MNFRKLGIVIEREYLNKVKKKSFLLITFLTPVLFAGIAILPSLIMMGTNDLMGAEASAVSEKYKSYIEGIRQENPGVAIYIQSTIPRRGTKNAETLSNDKINELNRLMMEYANTQNDVFYIDISTPLMDGEGNLKQSYSSDGYVHLNIEGYSVWVNRVVDYVRAMYLEKAVDDAKASSQAS
jgi:lysophospholipase L1-like esterase